MGSEPQVGSAGPAGEWGASLALRVGPLCTTWCTWFAEAFGDAVGPTSGGRGGGVSLLEPPQPPAAESRSTPIASQPGRLNMLGELPRPIRQRKRIFPWTGAPGRCSLEADVIGRLTGKLGLEEPDGRLLVDVGGVGYEVSTPVGTVRRASSGAEPGSIVLFIHTHVREDALELFGFASEADRALFRLLIGVQKVGPKLGLGLLSALSAEELVRALGEGDFALLCRVPGVGRKTAERLVLELRDRARLTLTPAAAPARPGDIRARLVGALVNMGYRVPEAERAVKSLGESVEKLPMAEVLRAALAALTQRRGG